MTRVSKADRFRSIGLFGIAKAAAKILEKTGARDHLKDGANHAIKLRVSGTVDGEKVSFPIIGKISVGFDSKDGATKNPDAKNLLALALEQLPKTKRELFFSTKKPKKASDDSLENVSALMKRLSSKGPRRGSVAFVDGKK